jgi:chromosome segregation ATPase
VNMSALEEQSDPNGKECRISIARMPAHKQELDELQAQIQGPKENEELIVKALKNEKDGWHDRYLEVANKLASAQSSIQTLTRTANASLDGCKSEIARLKTSLEAEKDKTKEQRIEIRALKASLHRYDERIQDLEEAAEEQAKKYDAIEDLKAQTEAENVSDVEARRITAY